MAIDYILPATTNGAVGQLDSNIGASDTTITLGAGEGDAFPIAVNGNATSGGTATTLNATGIGATGIAVGDYIENITDGSHAYVLTVNTNDIVTTTLRGGSGNTWDNNDEYSANQFVITLNARDGDGLITKSERALIKARASGSDILTVKTGGRGYGGSSAQAFSASDYVNLFVTSEVEEATKIAIAEILEDLDTKATTTAMNAALAARNWKNSCVAATTGAGTLATSFENGDTIDGVVLATGDRILIKDQATASENGVYIVAASGAPTRATDFDEDAEATSAVVAVEEGTANADTIWLCTDDTPNIGVDNINFTQFDFTASPSSQVDDYTSNDTWTKPAGAVSVKVICIGGGGGGASGRKGAAASDRVGGSGGGGAAITEASFKASELGATESVTVGGGGAGGAAQTTNDTDGNNGSDGGESSFGSWLKAGGGGGGIAGGAVATKGGAGGGSVASAATSTPGTPSAAADTNAIGGQGAQNTAGGAGVNSDAGGACGGGGDASGGEDGGSSILGAPGGGAGGSITSGDGESTGGAGGTVQAYVKAGGGAGGAASTNGGNGTANTSLQKGYAGSAGGGGGGSKTTNGGDGGTGGNYGSGGGGGGAALNAVGNSGAGGAGAGGFVRVISYF